jgi:hypothetical protein
MDRNAKLQVTYHVDVMLKLVTLQYLNEIALPS